MPDPEGVKEVRYNHHSCNDPYAAEYFVANRRMKEGQEPQYTITLEHLKHVEEFAELMNAITNSDRFSSIPKIAKERGEKAVYTLMFDAAEARGEARGEVGTYGRKC